MFRVAKDLFLHAHHFVELISNDPQKKGNTANPRCNTLVIKAFTSSSRGKMDPTSVSKDRRTSKAIMLCAASAVIYPLSDVLLCELVTLNYSFTTRCEKANNHLLATLLKSACRVVRPVSPHSVTALLDFLRQIIIPPFALPDKLRLSGLLSFS